MFNLGDTVSNIYLDNKKSDIKINDRNTFIYKNHEVNLNGIFIRSYQLGNLIILNLNYQLYHSRQLLTEKKSPSDKEIKKFYFERFF